MPSNIPATGNFPRDASRSEVSATLPRKNFSPRFDRALILSAVLHDGQFRKGTHIPYIVHPFHVALILDRLGFSEETVIAGLLHDVLEDTECDAERLQIECGERVLQLVQSVSEIKTEGAELRPWRIRKQEQLDRLRLADADAAALKGADALHNVASLLDDLEHQGLETMHRFNSSLAQWCWYHHEILSAVRLKLGGEHPLVVELEQMVARLEEWLERERQIPTLRRHE